jgi:hypothetical protein
MSSLRAVGWFSPCEQDREKNTVHTVHMYGKQVTEGLFDLTQVGRGGYAPIGVLFPSEVDSVIV